MGCYSVHIGGGEPFLNVDGLEQVLITAKEENMQIEYVETNSSWHRDEDSTVNVLQRLKGAGLRTLLISMSPFHNEHIPFGKVKGVIGACKKTGVSVFPWIQEFYPELATFDENEKHSLAEFREKFGEDYIKNIPMRYWIHYGGRAVQTYKEIYPLKPMEEILNSSTGCNELTDTSHFHADLFGNYIPGLCSGISIQMKDLGEPLNENEYPVITMLYNGGVKSLLEEASARYGFSPDRKYLNKCHLCFDIRKFMVRDKNIDSKELQPVEYYYNV